MLTRSKAKAIAKGSAIIFVSPSATGKGTHTRWRYPEGYTCPCPAPPTPCPISDPHQDDSDSESSRSGSAFSSCSILTSITSISPDSSFKISASPSPPPPVQMPATPQQQRTVITAPHTPKKLQRSPPAIRKWIEAPNGSARLVLVPDSFTQEDIRVRESMLELKLAQIAERELDILMAQRGHPSPESDGMDVDTDDDGDTAPLFGWPSDGSFASSCPSKYLSSHESTFAREMTEPTEAAPLAEGPKRLGPQGTELIDETTFRPRGWKPPVYPEEWRRAVLGQPTERVIE